MKIRELLSDESKCAHDLENPKRLGRAHYVCRKCGEDVTLPLVLVAEILLRDDRVESKTISDIRQESNKVLDGCEQLLGKPIKRKKK